MAESLNYLTPFTYRLGPKGKLEQEHMPDVALTVLALFNSLVLNYYIRNKISANVNLFYLYELPIPKLADKLRAKLVAAAEKFLASRTTPRSVPGWKCWSPGKPMAWTPRTGNT